MDSVAARVADVQQGDQPTTRSSARRASTRSSVATASTGLATSRVWLIALLNIGDIVATYLAISLGALEGNPVVAWMIETRVVVLAKILVCGSDFGAILARLRRRRVTLGGSRWGPSRRPARSWQRP